MTKLEHALDAASRGLRVFPQVHKRPRIRNWPDNASAKPSVITRWWTRWPDADIGVALDADIYVLDADTRDAQDAWADLNSPRTLMVETARGFHAYYRVPHQLARKTGDGVGLDSIEGKGMPGPVTWAGSVHPSGHVYTILVDAPIAMMPGPLVQAIGPRRARAGTGEATAAERATWARRHYDCSRIAADIGAPGQRVCYDSVTDARVDTRLSLRTLRCELPDMPTGWADRFFRAGAYLGPHVASGALGLDDAAKELTDLFQELDTQGASPDHVLRSIERGLATGARSVAL